MLLNAIQVLRFRLPKATGYLKLSKSLNIGGAIALSRRAHDSGIGDLTQRKGRRIQFAARSIPGLKAETFRANPGKNSPFGPIPSTAGLHRRF